MPPKVQLTKQGLWALKKGSEISMSLNELIEPHTHRLNLRSDHADIISKIMLILEENIRKENDQGSVIVLHDLREHLKRVKTLYLYPPTSAEDLHYFIISPFNNLEELCLNQIPPSTLISL